MSVRAERCRVGGSDIQTFSLVLTIWADLHDEERCVTFAASYPSARARGIGQ